MGYIFLHLGDSDAKTRDCREWSIPGMGYINVDRNWWFNHYTKTPRQVYDECNYNDVAIETTKEYQDMLPYIVRHVNFWKHMNNHEFIIPGRGYIYKSAKSWDFAPVTSYWIKAYDGKTPLEIYYTEGRQALEAKIAIFDQAIHAVRAITFRLQHGYYPKVAVKVYIYEAMQLAIKLMHDKFKNAIDFSRAEAEKNIPILPQVVDELYAIIAKHFSYLIGLGEVEPAEVTLRTPIPFPAVAIRIDDDVEEEEEELDRGSVIINEEVIPRRLPPPIPLPRPLPISVPTNSSTSSEQYNMGSHYSSVPLQTQGGPEHPIYVPSQTPIYIPSLSSAPTQVDSLSPTAPALGNNRTPSPTSQTSLVTDTR